MNDKGLILQIRTLLILKAEGRKEFLVLNGIYFLARKGYFLPMNVYTVHDNKGTIFPEHFR